jgi:hypothetical protein
VEKPTISVVVHRLRQSNRFGLDERYVLVVFYLWQGTKALKLLHGCDQGPGRLEPWPNSATGRISGEDRGCRLRSRLRSFAPCYHVKASLKSRKNIPDMRKNSRCSIPKGKGSNQQKTRQYSERYRQAMVAKRERIACFLGDNRVKQGRTGGDRFDVNCVVSHGVGLCGGISEVDADLRGGLLVRPHHAPLRGPRGLDEAVARLDEGAKAISSSRSSPARSRRTLRQRHGQGDRQGVPVAGVAGERRLPVSCSLYLDRALQFNLLRLKRSQLLSEMSNLLVYSAQFGLRLSAK